MFKDKLYSNVLIGDIFLYLLSLCEITQALLFSKVSFTELPRKGEKPSNLERHDILTLQVINN